MREAVQLQFGPLSNLIGSQFLELMVSAQGTLAPEVLAHDVMLHGAESEPRLVAFDLQSSFQQPILNPDDRKDINTWTGTRTIHDLSASSPVVEGVESWTSTLSKAGIRFRRQNQVRLPNVGGDLFQNGLEVIDTMLDDATDAVRRQIEKCDTLETIHTLADVDSLHGAIASVVLEQVHDDFCTSRQSLMTLPIWSSVASANADAAINRMMACVRLYECSTALVFNRQPTEDLNMDAALQALALYAGSACYRLTSSEFSNSDLLRMLVFDPALRFASLYASLNEEPTGRRFRREYRVAMGRELESNCRVASPISVSIRSPLAEGRPPLSRHSRHVPIAAVAEWTSAEPVFDRVLWLARSAQSLSPATAAARYHIEADVLEQIRESYINLSDAIMSYRDPGF